MAVSTEPAAEAAKATEPRWALEHHFGYDSPNSKSIDKDLDDIEAKCKALKADFEGKMATDLLAAIEAYEQIDIALTACLSYVSLASDTALDDDDAQKRKASLFQRYSGIAGNELTFFSLELADLPQEALDAQLAAEPEKLGKYRAFIDETRRSQPFNLSKSVERALTVRAPFAGKGKVVEFYGNELSRLRFSEKEGAEPVNMEVLLANMTSSKEAATRASCMRLLNDGLKSFERVAALSLNMVAGSWHVENAERGFKELRSQRNLGNNVPDEVVDSLLGAVRTTGVDYCKRYYALKKSILKETQGLETFGWSDRNAAIDIGTASDTYTWPEAVDIVRAGYEKFSPTMADLFTQMVDEKRIDVPAANGKRGGAYCSSAYGVGPFQLLNFTGTMRDVATLAHESGHGAHFMLSYKQGILQFHPPLTLAETASIFGEMIVFRDLLAKASTDEDRLAARVAQAGQHRIVKRRDVRAGRNNLCGVGGQSLRLEKGEEHRVGRPPLRQDGLKRLCRLRRDIGNLGATAGCGRQHTITTRRPRQHGVCPCRVQEACSMHLAALARTEKSFNPGEHRQFLLLNS